MLEEKDKMLQQKFYGKIWVYLGSLAMQKSFKYVKKYL